MRIGRILVIIGHSMQAQANLLLILQLQIEVSFQVWYVMTVSYFLQALSQYPYLIKLIVSITPDIGSE